MICDLKNSLWNSLSSSYAYINQPPNTYRGVHGNRIHVMLWLCKNTVWLKRNDVSDISSDGYWMTGGFLLPKWKRGSGCPKGTYLCEEKIKSVFELTVKETHTRETHSKLTNWFDTGQMERMNWNDTENKNYVGRVSRSCPTKLCCSRNGSFRKEVKVNQWQCCQVSYA